MIFPDQAIRIVIATKPVDFRKGHDGLAAMAHAELGFAPSSRKSICGSTRLAEWFGGKKTIALEEEIVGLGSYGYTLTVLSSDLLADDPDEFEDEEEKLVASWTPRFAYGR